MGLYRYTGKHIYPAEIIDTFVSESVLLLQDRFFYFKMKYVSA